MSDQERDFLAELKAENAKLKKTAWTILISGVSVIIFFIATLVPISNKIGGNNKEIEQLQKDTQEIKENYVSRSSLEFIINAWSGHMQEIIGNIEDDDGQIKAANNKWVELYRQIIIYEHNNPRGLGAGGGTNKSYKDETIENFTE